MTGALLGIIGVIIVICRRPGLPQAPPGMRAVKCPRCNTVQNVPEKQRVYECWQCKASNELWPAPPAKAPAQAPKSPVQKTKVRCHACQAAQSVPVNQATFVCKQCGTKLRRKRLTPNQTGSKGKNQRMRRGAAPTSACHPSGWQADASRYGA